MSPVRFRDERPRIGWRPALVGLLLSVPLWVMVALPLGVLS